jgi:hypothetical protein
MGFCIKPRTNEEGVVVYDLTLYYNKDLDGKSTVFSNIFDTSEKALQYALNNDFRLNKNKYKE